MGLSPSILSCWSTSLTFLLNRVLGELFPTKIFLTYIGFCSINKPASPMLMSSFSCLLNTSIKLCLVALTFTFESSVFIILVGAIEGSWVGTLSNIVGGLIRGSFD